MKTRQRILVLGLACGLSFGVLSANEQEANAQPAIDATVLSGVDQDTTAMAQMRVGGMWVLGRFAPEAHIGFDGFLRIKSGAGIAARSLSLLNVGARYGFTSSHFTGPFITTGVGYGIFTGKPHERELSDSPDICASAPPDENGQPATSCAYRIDKSINFRLGFGYGFQSNKKTTVALRLDLQYWMFSLNDFEGQSGGAPIPNMVDRPQGSVAVMLGLEFMRWK